jgi:hypothetical protein
MTTRPTLRTPVTASIRPAPAGLAIAALAILPLLVSGAQAQSVESRRDQPTPATLPDRTETSDRPVAPVAPPDAINSSTAIVASDRKGKTTYTNPLDHLPPADRTAMRGRRE